MTKREKIFLGIIIFLLLVCLSGCGNELPKVEDNSITEEIVIKPIEVVPITIKEIEIVKDENVTTWDNANIQSWENIE